MKNYFIYDGRANYDIDSACVVECFEAKNDMRATRYHVLNYMYEDTVLCDSDNNLIYCSESA